jgi:hypothetical protein
VVEIFRLLQVGYHGISVSGDGAAMEIEDAAVTSEDAAIGC